jgi:LysM repeat protein
MRTYVNERLFMTAKGMLVKRVCHVAWSLCLAVLLLGNLAATALVQAAPVAQETQSVYYTVQRGDTLSSIARRFNTTVDTLMRLNHLSSTRIYVGQRLQVTAAQEIVYTVQRSDTMSAIARRYGVTVDAIQNANNLRSTVIYVGQRLRIPAPGAEMGGRERIQFAAGATMSMRSGTLQSGLAKEYVARATQGQRMRVELTSADGSALLGIVGLSDGIPFKRTAVAGTVFEFTLPTTQDYLIQVVSPASTPVRYELLVEILPISSAPTTERIQFAPGATSATVTGTTLTLAPQRYVLEARVGQSMSLNLSVQSIFTGITLIDPSGRRLIGGEYNTPQWTGLLPMSGDYTIEVVNGGQGSVDFSLTVTIR